MALCSNVKESEESGEGVAVGVNYVRCGTVEKFEFVNSRIIMG